MLKNPYKKVEQFQSDFEHGKMYPSPLPKDKIYTIYSISNSPYQEWQAELVDYSFKKSGQPGTLIRLCSDDLGYMKKPKTISNAGYTLFTPSYAEAAPGKHCATLNKCYSIDYLFKNHDIPDDAVLVFLDPDMIFIKPWDPRGKFSKGTIYGQKWKGYGKEYCRKTSVDMSKCPNSENEAYMFPFAIMAGDLKGISREIAETAKSGFLKHNDWMVDMTGFLTIPIREGIKIETIENLGLCGDWNNADDPDAPIMHFCQPIKDKNGKKIWYKQDYKKWNKVPDHNLASNRVGREVLRVLGDLVREKNV